MSPGADDATSAGEEDHTNPLPGPAPPPSTRLFFPNTGGGGGGSQASSPVVRGGGLVAGLGGVFVEGGAGVEGGREGEGVGVGRVGGAGGGGEGGGVVGTVYDRLKGWFVFFWGQREGRAAAAAAERGGGGGGEEGAPGGSPREAMAFLEERGAGYDEEDTLGGMFLGLWPATGRGSVTESRRSLRGFSIYGEGNTERVKGTRAEADDITDFGREILGVVDLMDSWAERRGDWVLPPAAGDGGVVGGGSGGGGGEVVGEARRRSRHRKRGLLEAEEPRTFPGGLELSCKLDVDGVVSIDGPAIRAPAEVSGSAT